MASSQPAQGSPPELKMVLLGKTGAGKSAAGNTILGREVFKSEIDANSVTRECEKQTGRVCGKRIAVVDTPGFFDTECACDEKVKREIARCISLCSPGPHAFLLVMPVGRYTEHERETVREIQEMFSEEAWKYTIVLFTRADDLKGKTIEEFVQSGNKELRELVEKCGGRYHAFNNQNADSRAQVRELVRKIDSMLEARGGGCYTNEMYREAEAAIRRKQEELMKKKNGLINRAIEKLKEIYSKEGMQKAVDDYLQGVRKETRAEAENDNDFIMKCALVITVGAVLGLGLGGLIGAVAVGTKAATAAGAVAGVTTGSTAAIAGVVEGPGVGAGVGAGVGMVVGGAAAVLLAGPAVGIAAAAAAAAAGGAVIGGAAGFIRKAMGGRGAGEDRKNK